jgi:uncharacterized protein YbjT (DUF2867 family)
MLMSPTMRLVVFGGTGGTGIFVVREALASGHEVTVVARTPSKVTESHPKLEVVTGDVTDGASIVSAVKGKDAAISALGAASRKPPVTTTAVRAEVDARSTLEHRSLVLA